MAGFVSLVCSPADPGFSLAMSRHAESSGFDGIWLIDANVAAMSDPAAVLVVASAIGGACSSIRIGACLSLTDEPSFDFRVAEDIAVTDQLCGGRLDLAFVPPAEISARADWSQRVRRIFGAFCEWRLPDGSSVVATPRPAQRHVSRVLFDPLDDGLMAAGLGAGRMARPGWPLSSERLDQRVIVEAAPVSGPSAAETLDIVLAWAVERRSGPAGRWADEVAIELPVDATHSFVELLGHVAAPLLRSSELELPELQRLVTRWWHDTINSPDASVSEHPGIEHTSDTKEHT